MSTVSAEGSETSLHLLASLQWVLMRAMNAHGAKYLGPCGRPGRVVIWSPELAWYLQWHLYLHIHFVYKEAGVGLTQGA